VDASVCQWIGTIGVIAVLTVADFFLKGRRPSEVPLPEAGLWTTLWVVLAAVLGGFLCWYGNSSPAVQFTASYLTEKSLSIDNLLDFIRAATRIKKRLRHGIRGSSTNR
jgi:tellurite resistance protein TerC